MIELTLEMAERAARAAREKAKALGTAMTVTVVDEAGRLVLCARGDGTGFFTPETSRAKAVTAANFRMSTAELAERVTPYSQSLSMPWVSGAWNLEDARGLAALSREMARQAAMIGYLDAFVFFIATSLAVLPLVFLIRLKR